MVPHLLALAAALQAAAPPPAAVVVPLVREPPRVDCVLDDDAWRGAAALDRFHQTYPGDNAPPSHATRVRVAYTKDALHFGIQADAEPRRVRATLATRDAIEADDLVMLYLDTFHDRRRAYVVMLNPLGVQQDGYFVEGREPDFSFDILMESAGCVDAAGYSVELSIPFESLRYQAGSGRNWGLHVIRQLQHENEEVSWMPLRRDRIGVASGGELRARLLEQGGILSGLDGIERPKLIEWIPSGSLTRPQGEPTDAQLGGSARLTLSSSSRADVAINPDFAEVEADQPQSTANQRFPLFFEEKRPFFLEGAELFATPIRAFHSRAIVDPDAALKLTATRDRTSGTLLLAADAAPGPGTAWAGALRVRRDVGGESSLGLLATRRNFAGGSNEVLGLDTRLALGPRTVWTAQALLTRAATGTGFGYFTEWARSDARTSVQLVGEGLSPDYRATLGYTQRTDTNRWSLVTRYNSQPGDGGGPLVSWGAVNTLLVQFDWRGRMQYAYAYPRVLLTLPRQTFLNLYAYRDYVRVFETEFAGSGGFVGREERSSGYHGFTLEGGSAPTRRLAFSVLHDRTWNILDFDLGAGRFPRVSPGALVDPAAPLDPGPADYALWHATLALQPTEALRVTGSYDHGRLTRQDTGRDAFDQDLISLTARYAFTRDVWLRGRLDHDSLVGRVFHQLVLGWTPRPGTGVYLGYDETGEWNSDPQPRYTRRDRIVFLKASWSQRTRW